MLELKFALNVRGVAKISRERQPVRQGKTVFFAGLDHLAMHSTELGGQRDRSQAPLIFNYSHDGEGGMDYDALHGPQHRPSSHIIAYRRRRSLIRRLRASA